MGLLRDSSVTADHRAVLDVAVGVAEVWNRFGADDNGFELRIGQQQIEECCALGESILFNAKDTSALAIPLVIPQGLWAIGITMLLESPYTL